MKPLVLSIDYLPPFLIEQLHASFDFHHDLGRTNPGELERLAPMARAIVANGESKLTGDMLARFPSAEIISVFGVGYDGIDVAAARRRGIEVTHTPNVLTDDVADLAMALLLAVCRQIIPADRHVRSRAWSQGAFPFARKVSGSRLGIMGLGRIGKAIARRAEAFDMSVAYTGRREIPGVPYDFFPTVKALAGEVDFLMVAANGGPTTRGLVDAGVLDALGPGGYLVNVGRGSIVNEADLIVALQEKRIAGAALDVFADEPNAPEALFTMPNVVLTPHVASGTVQTRRAMADLTHENLRAHFSGEPLPSAVPRPESQ
jgi:hydroxypyruvate reductase